MRSRGFRAFVALILVFPWLASPCRAEGDWKISPHADFKFESVYYPSQLSSQVNQADQIMSLSVPTSIRWGHLVKFKFTPTAQWDPQNKSDRERLFGDLPEGYVQVQKSAFTFQGGFNTFNWGTTDIFNPLDVVSARRFFDPIRSPKLGVPSLYLRTDVAPLSLDLIYIPLQRKSILPGENSRWLPRDVLRTRSLGTSSGPATVFLPQDLVYSYSADRELDGATNHNVGVRLSGQISHFDWSLQAFNGASITPATSVSASGTILNTPDLEIQADPNIRINPTYYRQWVYGEAFTWVIGQYIVRGESAFTRPTSRGFGVPGHSEEHALEIEHNVQIGKDQVTVIVEGTYATHEETSDNSSTSLGRVFDRAGALALRYAPNEKLSFLGSAFYDFLNKGNFFHAETSYAVRDAAKLNLSVDNLNGSGNTPIGTYNKNGRVIAGFTYQF